MAKAKKRARNGFALFMWAYVLLFLALLGMLLRFGWRFLSDYEASQPDYFMDEYVQGLDEAHLRALADEAAAVQPQPLISQQALADYFFSQLGEEGFSYSRDKTVSYRNGYRYLLLQGEEKRGTVTIFRDEMPNFYTFTPWRVTEEALRFTLPVSEPVEVTVPESWKVVFNGQTLDESYIVETGLMIPGLEELYDESYAPEYLVTYAVTDYLSVDSLQTLDAAGQEHSLAERLADNAELFAASLYDNDNEAVRQLAEDYIDRYVRFSSNSNRNARGNLNSLKQLIVPGSDLDKRMEDVMDSLYWTNGRGYTITEIRVNSIMHLGEAWVADMTWVTDVVGQHGEVTTTVTNARFTIVDYNGKLLVERHKVY